MNSLPKGLLKKVIDEGYPPREAMKEAWQRVKTQQKRYAIRMSYGGGYPLGYKGRNPKRKKAKTKRSKNPLPIGFGARLKELIAEGLPAKEAMKEAWKEVKKSRTRTGTYSGSREIFGRKQRKNPKQIKATGFEDETTKDIQVDLHTREVAPPHLRDQKIMAAMREELYRRSKKRKRNPSEYHRGYADGKAAKQMGFRRGTAKDLGKASADYINGYVDGYKQRKPKKNPIAIYNPPGKQKLLYGRAYIPVIRGIKTNGKYKGEKYEHKFSKNEVSIYGNPDGSLIIKSNNNLRLWNYDKDI